MREESMEILDFGHEVLNVFLRHWGGKTPVLDDTDNLLPPRQLENVTQLSRMSIL